MGSPVAVVGRHDVLTISRRLAFRRFAALAVSAAAMAIAPPASAATFRATCIGPHRSNGPYISERISITLYAPARLRGIYFGPNQRCQQARGIAREWGKAIDGGDTNPTVVSGKDGAVWRCSSRTAGYELARTDCWRRWTRSGRLLKYHVVFRSGV